MKTSSSLGLSSSCQRRFARGLLLPALALGHFATAQNVGEVQYEPRQPGEPPKLHFDVTAPLLSRVSIDYSPTLLGTWSRITPPVTSVRPLTSLSVPLADYPARGFFRAVVDPPQLSIGNGVDWLVTVHEDGVSLDSILIGLSQRLGEFPLYALPYDPDSEETHPFARRLPTVPRGSYRGSTLAELAASMGLRLWQSAPKEDDERVAGEFKPGGDRGKPAELPGDGGTGKIDDGWRGDNIVAVPRGITGEPPGPGKEDMPYRTEVAEEDPKGQLAELDLRPGKHVRMRLVYDGVDFNFKTAVVQETGSGLLERPFPLPPPDSFVLVARNAAGAIYHLMPFEDPRHERAYQPPAGGSHGHQTLPEGSLRFTLPLAGQDIDAALKGLQLHIVKVARPPEGDATLLTPDYVDRHPNDFPIVGAIGGEDIARLLAARPPRRPRSATRDAEVSTLHRSGSNAAKFNIAVLADGFRDTATDQNNFNDYAEDVVMDTLLTRDIHPAVLNGANIFRVNTYSTDSGVTLVNSTGAVTTSRSTALEYRFSGDWNRCWMEAGPNSQALIDEVIDDVCPQADFVILVLNTTGFGGCAGGNRFTVTRGADWSVVAHEFGHRPGTLGDEYTCDTSCGCYGNGEPGAGNLTKNTDRGSLKWNMWVPSWRPLPTTTAQIASVTQDVGLFPGATIGQGQWTSCIFRPSSQGRMNNNSPAHNPVGYTNVREEFRPYQQADMRRNVTGDFNGDGRTDVVMLDDRQLALYLSGDRNTGADDPVRGSPPRGVTGVLTPTWYCTDYLRNAARTRSWQIRGQDILIPGDFDGDGLDDLYIVNLTSWNTPYLCLLKSFGNHFEPVRRYDGDLPGWQTRSGDQFVAGDFSGDGKADLMVFNGANWSIPYFGMLRSTGATLEMSRRYDRYLPGWEMGRQERFSIADLDGDGRQDVVAHNTQSWAQVHLMLFTSTGSQLALRDRYYGTIPGFWQMRRNDQLHLLDFTGDGRSDLALFNGLDWGPTYLGYLAVTEGTKLSGARRYDNDTNPLPGWQLQRRDRFYPANPDGDADRDLVVYNKDNWSTQYLGILRSSGGTRLAVQGSWQDDWIDGWNLGSGDRFAVTEFRGGAKWDDLMVFNDGWFGLLRGYQTHFRLETIYRKWIFNHRYHANGWW